MLQAFDKLFFYLITWPNVFSVCGKCSVLNSLNVKHNGNNIRILRILQSQFNNNTDRTLDVVFSRFRGFSFTITLRQRLKGVTRMRGRTGSFCLVIQCSMRVTPFGFSLRVLSVLLLIYACNILMNTKSINVANNGAF